MFWKKKKQEEYQNSTIILGMIMLQDEHSFPLDSFVADYNDHYSTGVEKRTGDNAVAILTISGEQVAIGHMPLPIPAGDIENTAAYAYNWQNVLEEVSGHKSHLIVSVMGGSEDTIKRYMLFTQVVCALLRTTHSIGVYMGNQSLLIPKEDYLGEAAYLGEAYLPLNLWVYFGLRVSDTGNSGYTYGLKEFGKTEMEILDSDKTPSEIREFLFNMAHYVLDYDVTFADGQTCGHSEEEKIAISLSKGNFVAGDTFKLAY